jgi:hypothetical protein
MGFWDKHPEHAEGGGGDYVSGEEKSALMESGQPFDITGVKVRNAFGSEQFSLTIVLHNEETGEDEDRIMTFTKGGQFPVESRDNLLLDMMHDFEEDPTAEPVRAKLTLVGRSQIIVPADE